MVHRAVSTLTAPLRNRSSTARLSHYCYGSFEMHILCPEQEHKLRTLVVIMYSGSKVSKWWTEHWYVMINYLDNRYHRMTYLPAPALRSTLGGYGSTTARKCLWSVKFTGIQ